MNRQQAHYDHDVDEVIPRAPWLRRLPSVFWTAVTWCAAALLALLLFLMTTYAVHSQLSQHPHRLDPWVRFWLAVAMALPIGWARRYPLPVLGVITAEAVVTRLVLRDAIHPFIAAVEGLICWIAATRPRRTSLTAVAMAIPVWLCEVAWLFSGPTRLGDVLSTLLSVASVIGVAWMLGNSIRQRRVYGEALRAQAAAQAVTAERLRIARDLHDMVAHSIGVIAIQAGAAKRVIETQPTRARDALAAIEESSRETLAGLRRMLVSLRRADAPEPEAPAGLADVERLAATVADAGVRVDVRWRGERRPLPPEVDLSAFRIIQESVTNVVRHSGTHHCRVSVDYEDEELAIEVIDDGRGLPTAETGTGLGITGMRERVALLHGRFSAGPRPEGGFRIAARLPV